MRSCHVFTQNVASSPSDEQIKGTMYMPEEYARIFSIGHSSRSKICNNVQALIVEENNQELLQILDRDGCPIANIRAYSSGMYIVPLICLSEGEDAAFCVSTWHERMGHPGVSMMRRITPSTKGHKLQVSNLFKDPRTQKYEREVERILHLNQLADRLPDSFNNAANVTKSHIPTVNVHARLERSAIQTTHMKRGRGREICVIYVIHIKMYHKFYIYMSPHLRSH